MHAPVDAREGLRREVVQHARAHDDVRPVERDPLEQLEIADHVRDAVAELCKTLTCKLAHRLRRVDPRAAGGRELAQIQLEKRPVSRAEVDDVRYRHPGVAHDRRRDAAWHVEHLRDDVVARPLGDVVLRVPAFEFGHRMVYASEV